MKLVLVRHLTTAWNREGRLQGRRDLPIAPLDESARTAISMGTTLVASLGPYDIVDGSTLQRTRQTAELFGYSGAQANPLLDELDFGTWEGAIRSEFLKTHGDAWFRAPASLSFGEPVAQLGARIAAFVRQHATKRAVLAFGHGAWIRAARALHDTGSLDSMNRRDVDNGGIVVLDYPT